jgi:hypothetical protein
MFKFIQTCSAEFTVQAKFIVHSAGLSANSAGLSVKPSPELNSSPQFHLHPNNRFDIELILMPLLIWY